MSEVTMKWFLDSTKFLLIDSYDFKDRFRSGIINNSYELEKLDDTHMRFTFNDDYNTFSYYIDKNMMIVFYQLDCQEYFNLVPFIDRCW